MLLCSQPIRQVAGVVMSVESCDGSYVHIESYVSAVTRE
jgi:hypothetical protein